jgi:hypothetical protein
MGCCNGKRAQWSSHTPRPPVERPRPVQRNQVHMVGFEYVGETRLTVLGPITRARYHFSAPGTHVEVDSRDAAYLSGVPNVRRAK